MYSLKQQNLPFIFHTFLFFYQVIIHQLNNLLISRRVRSNSARPFISYSFMDTGWMHDWLRLVLKCSFFLNGVYTFRPHKDSFHIQWAVYIWGIFSCFDPVYPHLWLDMVRVWIPLSQWIGQVKNPCTNEPLQISLQYILTKLYPIHSKLYVLRDQYVL